MSTTEWLLVAAVYLVFIIAASPILGQWLKSRAP